MRLLNTSTLEVQEFLESRVPEYVILSHTWREEEVTLQDLLSGEAPTKKGYAKLTGCCRKAKDDGFTYCWIDTCCIDKTSSAELSEAINSMYQWYKNACICYAYLEDVQGSPASDDYKAFRDSRWFSRGWTLQELIAPGIVEFYNASWSEIGTRRSLHELLENITGINTFILIGGDPLNCPVNVRMSWAARRRTTRTEDEAYCLLGLFDVNIPLLYGEGRRAFLRLQEEIMRTNEDYTLFAWDTTSLSGSLLASVPGDFSMFEPWLDRSIVKLVETRRSNLRDFLWGTPFGLFPPPDDHLPPHLTSRGLHVTLPLRHNSEHISRAVLGLCHLPEGNTLLLCVDLYNRLPEGNHYQRLQYESRVLNLLPASAAKEFKYTSITVGRSPDDVQAFADSGVEEPNTPIVVLLLDTEFVADITCIASSLINLRTVFDRDSGSHPPVSNVSFREMADNIDSGSSRNLTIARRLYGERSTEPPGAANLLIPLYTPESYGGYNLFRFHTVNSISQDLFVRIGVGPRPYCIAGLIPSTNLDYEIPSPQFGQSRERLDRTRVSYDALNVVDNQTSCFTISIRRRGAIAIDARHYVLNITKER